MLEAVNTASSEHMSPKPPVQRENTHEESWVFSCFIIICIVCFIMKFVLYEVTDDYDVIIKLSFENYTYLNAFLEQHTADKKYTPKFLVMELNAEGDIDFLSEFIGTKQNYRKCLAEFIE